MAQNWWDVPPATDDLASQAADNARLIRLLQQSGYGAQPEAMPQMEASPGIRTPRIPLPAGLAIPSLKVGGGTLDNLASAVLQSGPPPRGRGMGQDIAGGFVQGFARARAGRAQGRQATFNAKSEAVEKRNESRQKFLEGAVKDQENESQLRSRPSTTAPHRMGEGYILVDTPEKVAALEKQYPHMKNMVPADGIVSRAELFNVPKPEKDVTKDPEFQLRRRVSERGAINTVVDNYRQDKNVQRFLVVQMNTQDAISGLKSKNSYGDMTAMKAYAKATDPDTGVKEEEFRSVSSAVGALNKYGLKLTREMVGEGMLTDKGREYLAQQMRNLYGNRKRTYDNAYGYHQGLAKILSVDPSATVQYYPSDSDLVGMEDEFDEAQKKVDAAKKRRDP